MAEDLAENQLAAFVDRILRLKTEADDIAADVKEIYQEAHANGFNKTRLGEVVTYLRKVEKDATGEAEKAALRDLYLDAYYRAKKEPHAYARARGDEEEPEHDPETGEISTPIQPETANESLDDLAVQDGLKMSSDGKPSSGLYSDGVNADPSLGVTGGESAASNLTTFVPKPIRPHCQRPERCGGQGRQHCYTCRVAAEQLGAA